jgi:hypothetical protein
LYRIIYYSIQLKHINKGRVSCIQYYPKLFVYDACLLQSLATISGYSVLNANFMSVARSCSNISTKFVTTNFRRTASGFSISFIITLTFKCILRRKLYLYNNNNNVRTYICTTTTKKTTTTTTTDNRYNNIGYRLINNNNNY